MYAFMQKMIVKLAFFLNNDLNDLWIKYVLNIPN